MFEVTSKNGHKRLINKNYIESIGQLSNQQSSKTVIVMNSGETIYAIEEYNQVKDFIFTAL